MFELLNALVCIHIDFIEFQLGFRRGSPFLLLDVEVYLEDVVLQLGLPNDISLEYINLTPDIQYDRGTRSGKDGRGLSVVSISRKLLQEVYLPPIYTSTRRSSSSHHTPLYHTNHHCLLVISGEESELSDGESLGTLCTLMLQMERS